MAELNLPLADRISSRQPQAFAIRNIDSPIVAFGDAAAGCAPANDGNAMLRLRELTNDDASSAAGAADNQDVFRLHPD